MRHIFVSALAAISLGITGCTSITLKRTATWEPIPQPEKSIRATSVVTSEADVISLAAQLYKNKDPSKFSLASTPSPETVALTDRMISVSKSLNTLASVLDANRTSKDGKTVFNRGTVKTTLASVSLYQAGEIDLFTVIGDTLLNAPKTRTNPLTALGLDAATQQALMADAERTFSKARFVNAYLKAYFRGGRFAFAELKADDVSKKLSEDIEQRLKNDIGYDQLSNDAKKVADKLIEKSKSSIKDGVASVCTTRTDDKCLLTSALGEEAFITKGGRSIQFSGIGLIVGEGGKASLSVEKPESTEVAAQLVEVLTEALWDASLAGEVPAMAKSTACAADLLEKTQCQDEQTFSSQSQKIYERGDRAAAHVTSLASLVIRGGWLFSLDNEALAKALETAAGSSARKFSEYWNYQRAQTIVSADADALKGQTEGSDNSLRLKFSVK